MGKKGAKKDEIKGKCREEWEEWEEWGGGGDREEKEAALEGSGNGKP